MSIHTLIAGATIGTDNIDVDVPPTPRAEVEEAKYPRSKKSPRLICHF